MLLLTTTTQNVVTGVCTLPSPPFVAIQIVPFNSAIRLKAQSTESFLPPGENSCSVSSTSGPEVELGSSFKIYFTFKCPCKFEKSMCHPPALQDLQVLNSTTVFFNVANISRNQTYSCQCDCPHAPDSCGMDVSTGCVCNKSTPFLLDFWDLCCSCAPPPTLHPPPPTLHPRCFTRQLLSNVKMFCFLKAKNCSLPPRRRRGYFEPTVGAQAPDGGPEKDRRMS